MKILVMIKQVPDTATQIKVGSDPRSIDTAGITWIVSPYDEFAVEEGLRIKEKRGQGEVVAGSMSDAVPTKDLWTFQRDLKSRDPNWRLVETDEAA